MNITYPQLLAITDELKKIIINGKIEKIYMTSSQYLILEIFRQSQLYRLLISFKKGYVRIHLTKKKHKPVVPQTNFSLYLRKNLVVSVLRDISIENEDRIVRMKLSTENKIYYMVFHLFNIEFNAFILDDNDTILYTLFSDGKYKHNNKYFLPEKLSEVSHKPITIPEEMLYNEYLELKYSKDEVEISFEVIKDKYLRLLKKEAKKLDKLIANLEKDLNNCRNWELYNNQGELLKSQLHLIKKGSQSVIVKDYYSESLGDIEIKLDSNLSPIENVEKLFKKSKKLKSGIKHISKNLKHFEELKTLLNRLIDEIKNVESVGEIRENINKLFSKERNFLKRINLDKVVKPESQSAKTKLATKKYDRFFKRFQTETGSLIIVGRNNKENDRLTFSYARGNDTWFHVRDYPGSHVVLKINERRDPTQEELIDASSLALHYSKAKGEKFADVIMTKRKYLSKPKNAPAGLVTISKQKIMNVEYDEKRIRRLKSTEQSPQN